ncbi:hypothetical protein HK405_000394, partial [Cladochytrium tenue]
MAATDDEGGGDGFVGDPLVAVSRASSSRPSASSRSPSTSSSSSSSAAAASAAPATCPICLDPFRDRSVLPACLHAFCFACIARWAAASPTPASGPACPLCKTPFRDCLHSFSRDGSVYIRTRLFNSAAPSSAPRTSAAHPGRATAPAPVHSRLDELRRRRRRGGGATTADAAAIGLNPDDPDYRRLRGLLWRRWIYQNRLFCRHMGSTPATQFRNAPTPAQVRAAAAALRARVTPWLRRELRAVLPDADGDGGPAADVELLVDYVLAVMER